MQKINIWDPYELKIVSSNGELALNSQGLNGTGSAYHVIGSTGLSGIPVVNRFRDGLVAGGVHVNQRLANREILLKIALNTVYDPNNPDEIYNEEYTKKVYIGDAQEVDSGGNAVYDENGSPIYSPVYSDVVSNMAVHVSYHRKKLDDLWNNVTHIIMGDSLRLICTYANGEVWELELVYESGLEGNFASSKLYQFANRHFAYIDLAFQSPNPYWWSDTQTLTFESASGDASVFLHPLQSLKTSVTSVFTNDYKITNDSLITSPITWSLRGTMASGSTFGVGDNKITLNVDLELDDILTITPRWNQSPIIQINGEDRLDAVTYPIHIPELVNGDNTLSLDIQGDTPSIPVLSSTPAYYNYALNPQLMHENQIITTNQPCQYAPNSSTLTNADDEIVTFSYNLQEIKSTSQTLQLAFDNSVDAISPTSYSNNLGIAWGNSPSSAIGTFNLQGFLTASNQISNSIPLYISMIGQQATQQYINSFEDLATAVRNGGYYVFTNDIDLNDSLLDTVTISKDTYFNLNSHTLTLKPNFNFILSLECTLYILEGDMVCSASSIDDAPTLTMYGNNTLMLYDLPNCDVFHIDVLLNNCTIFIYNTKLNLYKDKIPCTITEKEPLAGCNGIVYASYNGETTFAPPILNTINMKCIVYGAQEAVHEWGHPDGATQNIIEYAVSDDIEVDNTISNNYVSEVIIKHMEE